MSGKLKEVKNRIASVKSTQQITKAMKLVAASKLKKATDQIQEMRPYSAKLSEMLANIAAATEGDVDLAYAKTRKVNKVLMVVITSDKGLCGSFNANLIKAARVHIEENYADQLSSGNVSVMTIGKKGNDFFKKYEGAKIIDEHMNLFKNLSFDQSLEAIESVLTGFENSEFDEVMVSYSEFKNAAVQNFKMRKFLPIQKLEAEGDEIQTSDLKERKHDYIFQPEKEQLIKELAPKILKTQFYSFMLDNNASEHGARMTAMENASENANEILRELKIKYNKERQAAITTELTEIVSGAAALEGG